MNEVLTVCPVCGKNQLEKFTTIKDFSISKEDFDLCRCINCDFVFTNPRPDKFSISRYYESPDYISHSNSKEGLFNKAYQFIRQLSINNKIKLISKYSDSDNSLLDFGCGTGEFLAGCAKKHWAVMGVEPNEKARNFGIENYHLNVKKESELKDIQEKSFKIITLWHVLEHIHDLNDRIKDLSSLLKDNGILIVAVPNFKSKDADHYKQHWAAYDVPRHLYHFSEKTIKQLFNKHNFDWIQSFPMKFDSYYVSLLSEKYRKSKLGSIRAIFAGLRSNIKAGSNPEKYSSVIYVFRKK